MYAEILASQVPEFIRDADVFSDVQLSEGNELDRIKYALDDLEKQLSPITATWALPFWEDAFGIPVNLNDSYEIRYARIAAKLNIISPLTPHALERILARFASDVVVENVPGQYKFIVTFNVTKDFNAVVDNINRTIEEVKPAHLVYEITFGFRTNLQINVSSNQYFHDCHYCGMILAGQYKL